MRARSICEALFADSTPCHGRATAAAPRTETFNASRRLSEGMSIGDSRPPTASAGRTTEMSSCPRQHSRSGRCDHPRNLGGSGARTGRYHGGEGRPAPGPVTDVQRASHITEAIGHEAESEMSLLELIAAVQGEAHAVVLDVQPHAAAGRVVRGPEGDPD